ncbi:unnamed protein product [Amoebophrya sp. A120]|nr:unnamed protein product [Amoebophrya sp. A120]|eukprot:GSA120T00025845001.1
MGKEYQGTTNLSSAAQGVVAEASEQEYAAQRRGCHYGGRGNRGCHTTRIDGSRAFPKVDARHERHEGTGQNVGAVVADLPLLRPDPRGDRKVAHGNGIRLKQSAP